MSVAAMTMDDQRPLMNNFETMKKQYDNLTNAGSGSASASAAAVVCSAAVGSGSVGVGGGVNSVPTAPSVVGAPPSGPASPTPSTSEEQQSQHHHHHHHHHSTHHSTHHHHPHHQQHQLQQPTAVVIPSQQQQQSQPSPYDADAAAAAVAVAEQRQRLLEEEIESLKVEQTRLSQQCSDAQRREKILMRRLANKEQEFQDYVSQIAEYKAAQAPGAAALRSALLDPAVNLLFEKLKKELKATKAKLEETQNELSAWKFTPDSNTGKRLMAKCRLLYQENEELGKMTSNGRLAKLETELAMQKSFSEEVKKSQSELDDFIQELDEDIEGMQSTILFLQQELKTTRDRIQVLEKENYQLKNGSNENTTDSDVQQMQHLAINGSNNSMNNSTIISSIMNNQLPSNAANVLPNATPIKIQPLETIDENICLRTNNTLPPNTNEFYNGIEDNPNANTFAAASVAGDDGSNSNSSNNSAGASKLRSAGSRKRNYDSDTNENVVAPLPQVATPRTLPPKKSKLRVTPVRRASMQSVDINENDNALPLVGSGGSNTIAMPEATGGGNAFVDNAVVGMANEEGAMAMSVDGGENNGGVAQRIMTRRRSVRNQQNGDSNH